MPYITVDDVRAAGYTAGDDADVTAAILVWQEAIERFTRQWFESRELDITVDGTDSDTLHFPIPIIAVTALHLNDGVEPLHASVYRVYNGRSFPDDRKNPRIKLRSLHDHADIYTAPIISGQIKFLKGRQNQRVVGTFGYTEADGSTPALIKRALTKLVIRKLATPMYIDPSVIPPTPPPLLTSGIVTEEWTDGHRLKYADSLTSKPRRPDGMSEIIDDAEIRGILKMYRAPIGMATPANPSYGH